MAAGLGRGVALFGPHRLDVAQLRVLLRSEDLPLICIMNRDGKKIARLRQDYTDTEVRASHDVASVLSNDSVAGVILCGSFVNVNMIRKLMKAGKAVLCDKPVALTPVAIAALYGPEPSQQPPLLFNYHRRWDPAFKRLQDLHKGGACDRLSVTSNGPMSYLDSLWQPQDIDTVCWALSGQPEQVKVDKISPGTQVTMDFRQATATITAAPSLPTSVQMRCNNESFHWETDGVRTKVRGSKITDDLSGNEVTFQESVIKHFVQLVKGKANAYYTKEDMLRVAAVCRACAKSAASGKVAAVEETASDQEYCHKQWQVYL